MSITIPGKIWAEKKIRELYDWMGSFTDSPYGDYMLGAFFFIEAIFFFPADPLLVFILCKKTQKSIYYATIATIASVIGGVGGYYIGYSVWSLIGQKLVALITTEEAFKNLCEYYALRQNWAVLIAGFTPIPYKLVTLTAGFCKLSLLPFIVCSFIARGARFYLVGIVMYFWGKTIQKYIDQYFNTLVIIFMLLVLSTILMIK